MQTLENTYVAGKVRCLLASLHSTVSTMSSVHANNKFAAAAAARLWHIQLVQSYSFWTSAGICPVRGRKDGETWKQLVSTAYGIKAPRPDDGDAATVVYTTNYDNTVIRDFWDKGQRFLLWKASHKQSSTSVTVRHA